MKLFTPACTLVVFLSVGCTGPQGPGGSEYDPGDVRPPEVELTRPPANSTVYGDSVLLAADATDPEGEIWYVSFLVNGSNKVGDDSAAVFDSLFEYVWDFSIAGTPQGINSLVAAAFDTSGNSTVTPMRLFYRSRYSGSMTISYHDELETIGRIKIPYADSLTSIDSSKSLRRLRYFNVRFTMPAPCELIGVEYYFEETFGGVGIMLPGEFKAIIWNSSSDGTPGEPIDLIVTKPSLLQLNSWLHVDLSKLIGDSAGYTFTTGEEIHIGLEPSAEWAPEIIEGLALRYSVRSDTNSTNRPVRSYALEDGIGGLNWKTTSEFGDSLLSDFYIRAIVDYGNGEQKLNR